MATRKYSITAPDGTELSITGPVDATPEQLRQAAERAYAIRRRESFAFASQAPATPVARESGPIAERSQFAPSPTMVDTRTGMGAEETQQRGLAGLRDLQEGTREAAGGAVRYGGPVAAGLAAAPAVAPTAAGAALLSLIGGVSGYGSSVVGQFISDGEVSQREAMADAAMMSSPMRLSGNFLARAGINIPSLVGAFEASEAIRTGGYELPQTPEEAFKRWGLLAGMAAGGSYFGARAQRVAQAEKVSKQLASERMGGAAMISEMFQEFTPLETRMIARNGKNAVSLMERMDMPFDEAIARSFPEGQTTEPMRRYLREQKDRLVTAQTDLAAARQASEKADRLARELSGADNVLAYRQARQNAYDAALELRSAELVENWAKARVGNRNPLTVSDVGFSEQVNLIGRTLTDARNSLRQGINAAYMEAGIGPNTPVITLEGVKKSISSQSRRGGAFNPEIFRRETIAAVEDHFEKYGVNGTLSLEGYQKLQDTIAKKLTESGVPADKASKQALAVYNSLKNVSDRYIQKTMPEQWRAYDRARGIVSRDFALRETPAMEMLQRGDADGFYAAITKEGNGATLSAIGQFSELLARSGNPEAGRILHAQVNEVIARGVLNRAAQNNLRSGRDAITQLVDPKILARELDGLRSQGFPVEQLGLGTSREIRAAARLSTMRGSGVMSKESLDEFLTLSREVGLDAATAKTTYWDAVYSQYMHEASASPQNRRLAAYNARKAAQSRYITQADKQEALIRIENDPLVRLLTDPTSKVPVGAQNSAAFNAKLMELEPNTARAFVDAMEAAGRGGDVENLRRGLAYGVMNRRRTLPDGRVILDANAIAEFFDPRISEYSNQRAVFKSLMGKDRYETMERDFVRPLMRVAGVRRGLGAQASGVATPTFVTRIKPPEDLPIKGTLVGTPRILTDLLDAGRYNTLYTLYVNPNTAPMWASAMRTGGDLSRQPVLATAIRLAQEQDDKDAATNP
jgi:hypothetical protein